MSEENVEVVWRHIEAWNQSDLTAWLATFRSDAEIDWSRARALYKGVYRGHAEHETFWEEFWSTFETIELEVHDLTEAGAEVVVWNTARISGRHGIEVTARSALAYTVENGEITRLRLFQGRDEALEAIGRSKYSKG
jgi:ketosteroid isomerase-like protein